MRLRGWNEIPAGYGATFDVASAPGWLRALYRTPFIDRFAYPMLVSRGLGTLTPHPAPDPRHLGEVGTGWRIEP